MQKVLKVALLAVALLAVQSAMAEWYVSIDTIDDRAIPYLDSLSENSSLDIEIDRSGAISLVGGYHQNRFFSVELEYLDALAFESDGMLTGSSLRFPERYTRSFESNALFLSGTSRYFINDSTSLNMKGGVFNWEVDTQPYAVKNDTLGLRRTSGIDIFYGFSANYDLNARFEISAEWERYRMEESDIDYLSTELKFRF